MARTCTVCRHGDRPAIDMMLVNQRPYRNIAERSGLSLGALVRHHDDCLPETLARAKVVEEQARAIDVMAELKRCLERVNLVFDACDRWLRDPEDPTRYDVGVRSEDVQVIYLEMVGDKAVLRKSRLSALLAKLEDAGVNVQRGEFKHADPRELVLKTADRVSGTLELLVKMQTAVELAERVAALEREIAEEGGTWTRQRAR